LEAAARSSEMAVIGALRANILFGFLSRSLRSNER
jgi:hypothetical protein